MSHLTALAARLHLWQPHADGATSSHQVSAAGLVPLPSPGAGQAGTWMALDGSGAAEDGVSGVEVVAAWEVALCWFFPVYADYCRGSAPSCSGD